jgi:hypothetical protein
MLPSVVEKTLQRYSGGDNATKTSEMTASTYIQPSCFGCGDPHPWSKKVKGVYVVCCPNADKPGIRDRAAANIKAFQARRGKKHQKNAKRKNLNTVNWEDIPAVRRKVLLQQHCAGSVVTTDATSVASSITGATSKHRASGHITLHQDVVVFTGHSSKLPIPVSIHSPMAHITLQTGVLNEEQDCPNLRCVFDTGAALSTANLFFMEAVIRQYPHILKKLYLPEKYTSIVLSGIVTANNDTPVTTELLVGFKIHLPYMTKDGNETSFLVATGADVAMNLIIGLPFIKATGMIGDFVDNVCQAKHLLCDPFPIDFRHATKSIPVFGNPNAPCNTATSPDPLTVLASLRELIVRNARAKMRFNERWVPPTSSDSSASSDANDYQHQVLGDLGYL